MDKCSPILLSRINNITKNAFGFYAKLFYRPINFHDLQVGPTYVSLGFN